MSPPILIAGAGLAGSLLAAQLAQRGFRVEVIEKRGDIRREEVAAGRSINLALAERGWEGLERASAVDAVRAYTLPMRGRCIHDREGRTSVQPYGIQAEEIVWSVHRGRLNQTLLDVATAAGARLDFHVALENVDFERRSARLAHADGRIEERAFAVLIGADGAGSAVRAAMNALEPTGEHVDFLDHGYKELRIDPAPDGGFRMDPEALHIWPRGRHMLIALPNPDGSFTLTLFLANHGEPSFASLRPVAAAREFFARDFADALALMPDFDAQWAAHPVGLLGTLRCPRWHQGDAALLIGDAAHAIVPFHGQGMNCAFEDCVELLDLIEHAGGAEAELPWARIFAEFEHRRRPNAHAIAEMALDNYLEMRDAVADPRYQLRRALELELARRLPGRFVPRYSLVMFHRVPYAEARERGERQRAFLESRIAGCARLEDIDLDAAEAAAVRVLSV
jgi:kynurenine 3-monooxygenase